jgi:hypothetical protein
VEVKIERATMTFRLPPLSFNGFVVLATGLAVLNLRECSLILKLVRALSKVFSASRQ